MQHLFIDTYISLYIFYFLISCSKELFESNKSCKIIEEKGLHVSTRFFVNFLSIQFFCNKIEWLKSIYQYHTSIQIKGIGNMHNYQSAHDFNFDPSALKIELVIENSYLSFSDFTFRISVRYWFLVSFVLLVYFF